MLAYLELIDRDTNTLKFYRIEAFENMFGDWQVDRAWGRIGETNRDASSVHVTWSEALQYAYSLLFLKLRRGYERKEFYRSEKKITRLIPRARYSYLDVELGNFFASETLFYQMAVRMSEVDILFVGDLVQLEEEDILFFGKRPVRRSPDEAIPIFVQALDCYLSNFGLALAASVPGWRRPDSGSHDFNLSAVKRLSGGGP